MPEQTQQKTLAQRIRAKYPGAYDDLSDVQLEQKVLAKFPEYKDLPLTQEAPLTRERAPQPTLKDVLARARAEDVDRSAKNQALLTEHLPTIGGMVGGLAAAPFTGGMSIPAALALTAGGAGLGGMVGAIGREGLEEVQGVETDRNLLTEVPKEGLIQGGSQLLGGALAKGAGVVLSKGGNKLYEVALRPEMKTLAQKFGGVTRQGIAEEAVKQGANISKGGAQTAANAIRASEGFVDDAVAALPKGTMLPTKPITSVAGAAKPVIKAGQQEAAANAVVKPVFKHVRSAGQSHADQISPRAMLDMQRATSIRAGSPSGVMPPSMRPAPGNVKADLIEEANRAMAGAAQNSIEAAAPSIAGVQAQIPLQYAVQQAIETAAQRPLLSQYAITGAALPFGAAIGGYTSGDISGALGGTLSAAALANPRTLSNLAIAAARGGQGLSGTLGQVPANAFRGLADLAQQPQTQDFGSALEVPPPSPLDPTTSMRLIPREDYWTPR